MQRRHLPVTLERTRHRAAVAAAGAASLAAYAALHSHSAPLALAVGATLAAATVGFARRSLPAQIAARGATYLACLPLAAATWTSHSALSGVALVALIAALALGRPLLHSKEARREFNPTRFRHFFLAGATASTTAALGAVAYAAVGVAYHSPIMIAFNAGLAAVLLVAVRSLLSMRTWGLILGGITSVALLALTPFYGAANAITLTLAAIPALLFWATPILLARSHPEARLRVAADASIDATITELLEQEPELEEPAEPRAMRRG